MTISDLKPGTYDNVSVLFTDIRNFTKLTNDLPLEEVMAILRVYYEKMAGIILNNDGIVGSFVGDAIVGYFGLGSPSQDSLEQAARAALMIKEEIRFVNIGREFPIMNGVGIDVGSVIVGSVCADSDKQTIVIGSPINKASRFERLTRTSCHRIIMSKRVYDQLSPELKKEYVNIGNCEVRGLEGLMNLYADCIAKE